MLPHVRGEVHNDSVKIQYPEELSSWSVSCVAVSADRAYIAVFHKELYRLVLMNGTTGRVIKTLKKQWWGAGRLHGMVSAITISHDNCHLFVFDHPYDDDFYEYWKIVQFALPSLSVVRHWSTKDNRKDPSRPLGSLRDYNNLQLSTDDRLLYVGGSSNVQLLDLSSNTFVRFLFDPVEDRWESSGSVESIALIGKERLALLRYKCRDRDHIKGPLTLELIDCTTGSLLSTLM